MSVTLSLSGYQPQKLAVHLDEDAAGAPRLTPNPVYAELVPVPSAPAAKKAGKKKKTAPKKRAKAKPKK